MNLGQSRGLRYLLAGGWNTLFGYTFGIWLYYALSPYLHIIGIGIIGNIVAITMSFLTYKLFVFRTKGQWLSEYLRSYVVYGGTAIFGILLLWGMVDGLSLKIWLAQGIGIVITVLISYVGHKRITFRRAGGAEG